MLLLVQKLDFDFMMTYYGGSRTEIGCELFMLILKST